MHTLKKTVLLLLVIFTAVTLFSCKCGESTTPAASDVPAATDSTAEPAATDAPKTNDELYAAAVRDAVFAEEDEILPLVNITKDDENVIWDGDKVLVAFLHKYPDSYPDGEEINLQWGNVWCVSALEFYKWIRDNGEGVTDWSLRLHQVMGMPEGKATSVTVMWVNADLLHRPAYVTDKTAAMQNTLIATGDEEFDAMYKEWFDGNIIWSYFDSAFPWTRLGYTYDWADNGKKYGVSEFLVFSGADAKIEKTLGIDELVEYAREYFSR